MPVDDTFGVLWDEAAPGGPGRRGELWQVRVDRLRLVDDLPFTVTCSARTPCDYRWAIVPRDGGRHAVAVTCAARGERVSILAARVDPLLLAADAATVLNSDVSCPVGDVGPFQLRLWWWPDAVDELTEPERG